MWQFIILAGIIFSLFSCGSDVLTKNNPSAYKKGEVIVKFKSGAYETSKYNAHSMLGAKLIKKIGKKEFEQVQLPEEISVEQAIAEYETNPDVEYAEPNYIVRALVIPNDSRFNELWGLYNTGQTVNKTPGTAGADISVIEAWDILHDSSAIVAVLDTGIDSNHPDMSANLIPGYDFVDKDTDPEDVNGHGTHMAGIIGAVGNNMMGITGVSWQAKIMPLKVLDLYGEGFISDIVDAIDYAVVNDARIISMSFGEREFSQTLYETIEAYPDILFVAAAGNSSANNDLPQVADYPASYDLPNIISVASTNQNDNFSAFSNYGLVSVDLAAPGENILSTIPSYIGGITYSGVYKLVYFAFGFEAINGLATREAVMQNVLNSFGLTQDDKILLVDDDGRNFYEAYYTQALQNLGYGYDVHTVPDRDSDGPNASELSLYKAVIWFTADEFSDIFDEETIITSADQINLASYLNQGGRLFMTGQDIGYDIGDRPFYRDYLHSEYITDDANGFFYTGLNYFSNYFIDLSTNNGDSARYTRFVDAIKPVNSTSAFYIDYNDAYQFFDGTSMSTAIVSGVAALLATYYSNFNADEIKGTILTTVDILPSLQGKMVSEGRINALNAITSLRPPSNLTATADSETQVTLTWTDNSTAEQGFKIERKLSGESFQEISSVPAGQTSFVDTGLQGGRTYTYRIRAFNDVAESPYSPEISVSMPGGGGGGGGGGCSVGKFSNHQTAMADTLILLAPCIVILLLRRFRK